MLAGAQTPIDETTAKEQRIAELEAELARRQAQHDKLVADLTADLAATKTRLDAALGEHDKLKQAYLRALEELQLARRRLFVAKAERRDASAEQLAFDSFFAKAVQAERALAGAEAKAAKDKDGDKDKGAGSPPRAKPKGRRNLAESTLPIVRVEITDPALEGKAERIGFRAGAS